MKMNFFITEYKPSKNLQPYVELYWEGSFNIDATGSVSIQILPNGCLDVIFHLNDLHCDYKNDSSWSQTPDYMVIGLFTKPYQVQFKNLVNVFAIRFKPEGIYNVFGIPASELTGRFEDMTQILGKEYQDFSHRLKEEKSINGMLERTENYLLKNLLDRKIDLGYVNFAAELIRKSKEASIENLTTKLFVSQRQLEREFKDKIGITPKHYQRLTRINEVLRLLNDRQELDLTSVAYYCGYFDQAHFINDFKSFTGLSPSIYAKGNGLFIAAPGLSHYEH